MNTYGQKMSQGPQSKRKGGCSICELSEVGNMNEHVAGKKHKFMLQQKEQREREANGLFLTGFPDYIDVEKLRTLLGSFGKLTEFYHNQRNNFVILAYEKRETADRVFKNPLIVGHRRIIVRRRKARAMTNDSSDNSHVKPPSVDHTRVQEILLSGGPLEDVLRELEVPLEDRKKYSVLMKDLEDLFKLRFKDCKAHAFGSTRTGLCIKGSDIDVFLEVDGAQEQLSDTTNAPLPERLVRAGQRLMYQHKGKFAHICAIAHAKTPIIKFVHVPTNISCDVSFKNALGIANSELIKHYIALDKRVYPYFMLIKYWARKHDFSGSGKITNYALITLAAFYLQQLEEPVLPSVHRLQELSDEKEHIDGWLCSFSKDPNAVEPSKNTSSLFELLAGFFDYYDKLNIGDVIVCPYLGRTVPKIYFLDTEKLPEPLKTIYNNKPTGRGLNVIPDLCVQDPFELTHNMTAGTGRLALTDFHDFTRLAVKVCQELHTAEEKKKIMVLSKLFSAPPAANSKPSIFKLSESEMLLTIFADGFLSLALFLDVEKAFNSDENRDGSPQKWFLMIQNLVIRIFTKIMKFEVQSVENETANKVRKVEAPSDVHDPANVEEHDKHVVDVQGCYNMWDDRRRIQKGMGKTVPKSHCLDVEEAVSNELFKQRYAATPLTDPIVKFTCEFFCVTNPPSVRLVFKDKGSAKGVFFQVMSRFRSKLPALIEKYCKYMKQKARVQFSGADESQKEEEEEVNNDSFDYEKEDA